MKDNIKSPINYTGNKYRLIDQITPYFPKKINCMMDLFCGGATVGLNANTNKVIFVDENKKIIELLEYISNVNFDNFINMCEEVIKKYNLSISCKNGYKKYRSLCKDKCDNNGLKDYNTEGFYKLREDYNRNLKINKQDKQFVMLYLLMVYGFNNDIRFNSRGEYNLPVGKTDLNKNNVEKIQRYIDKSKISNFTFINTEFDSPVVLKLLDDVDFVYMDPPYLVGNAVYNNTWSSQKEHKLLDFIDVLISKKINFALSNVTKKVGKKNEPLEYWIHKNKDKIKVIEIDYHYKSSSYNKINRNAKEQEVLIVNKRYNNED